MKNNISFEFNLSTKSIAHLVNNLNNYRKQLELAKPAILEALADYTYTQVVEYVNKSIGHHPKYTPTGNLANSIMKSEVVQNAISVYADYSIAKYAQFVEFGTGVVGSQESHALASEYGWVYGVSTGQEAHNFMYRARKDLEREYPRIVARVLRERGLIK